MLRNLKVRRFRTFVRFLVSYIRRTMPELSRPFFNVNYFNPDGSLQKTLTVTPVRLRPKKGEPGGQKQLVMLYQSLLEDFAIADTSIGEMLGDDAVYEKMAKIAAMLPVVGQPTPGFDIEPLFELDDRVQLCHIFFTVSMLPDGSYSYKDEDGNQVGFKPSHIARIHNLKYLGRIREAMENLESLKAKKSPPAAET